MNTALNVSVTELEKSCFIWQVEVAVEWSFPDRDPCPTCPMLIQKGWRLTYIVVLYYIVILYYVTLCYINPHLFIKGFPHRDPWEVERSQKFRDQDLWRPCPALDSMIKCCDASASQPCALQQQSKKTLNTLTNEELIQHDSALITREVYRTTTQHR